MARVVSIVAVACMLSSAACDIAEPIDADASNLFFPTARVHVDLEDAPPQEAPSPLAGVDGSVGLEFGVTGASGDLDVTGPQLDHGDFDLFEATALLETRMVGSQWDGEAMIGLGYERFDATFAGPVLAAEQRDHFIALVVAVELAWDPHDRIRVFGRLQPEILFPLASALTAEIGLELRIVDATSATVTWRTYQFDRSDFEGPFGDTELQVDLQGIAVGVETRF